MTEQIRAGSSLVVTFPPPKARLATPTTTSEREREVCASLVLLPLEEACSPL